MPAPAPDYINRDLHGLLRRCDALTLDPKNARQHPERNLQVIGDSLRRFGQQKAIIVRDGVVVAGNGTLLAARALTWEYIAATEFLGSAKEAAALAVLDNRSAELASWDTDNLAEILSSLPPDMAELTGFSRDEIDLLTGAGGGEDGNTDPDEVPPQPAISISVAGDIWCLGAHRLMCGDSRSSLDVARLMVGERAHMMWTDPPYGVSYVGGTARKLQIQNDDAAGLGGLLLAAFEAADAVLGSGAAIYIAHPAGALSVEFATAVLARGWRFHQTLVWVKDSLVLGHSDYHYQHEPIILAYKPGSGRRGRGGEGWYGDNSQTSVFQIPRPKRSEDHPTTKPVELVGKMVANSSPKRGVVYEPFSGSGTTIIACEQLGRACRAIEIAPPYTDVGVRRWEEFSGKSATLEATGQTFAEVAAERGASMQVQA